ncbi:MAG: ImmA/IrrE family metallo-endopeptidase, partial [Clostridia bacterium]
MEVEIISKTKFAEVAQKLIKQTGSRDPFEIADTLGIEVSFHQDFGNLKGMYSVIKRNRYIFINDNLSEQMQRVVCAHELAHDQLHRHLAKKKTLHEFMLYDMSSTPEYEANMVASELLIDTDEILDYIYTYNYSLEQIASAFNTDVNLVGLKIGYLRELGYDLRTAQFR